MDISGAILSIIPVVPQDLIAEALDAVLCVAEFHDWL